MSRQPMISAAGAAGIAPPARGGASERLLVALSLFALYSIWGSTYLAMRIAVRGFPPFFMAGTRFLTAGTVLFTLLRLRGMPAPNPRQWRAAAVVGVMLVACNALVTFSEQGVSSGLTAIMMAGVPLWAALFSGFFGRWPGKAECVGLALGLVGVAILNAGGELRAQPLYAAALFVGPASWAFGSVWGRRLPLPVGLMGGAAQMIAGGAIVTIFGLTVGERPHVPPAFAVHAWLYLMLLGSVVGFSAYDYLLRHTKPIVATSYAFVNPAIAVWLGVALARERPSAQDFIAMPIILSGVALVMLGHGRGGGMRRLPANIKTQRGGGT